MLWSKHYINKFFSGALLIVLLLVHSVKLLHSHPSTQFRATSAKTILSEKLSNNAETKGQANCEICDYQITKDTDGAFSFIEPGCKIEQQSFYNEYILTSPTVFHLTSESRGPPVA